MFNWTFCSAWKEGETYSASIRHINATAPPRYFFLPPLRCRHLSILLLCERLGSLLEGRISLCTLGFFSPLQGLVPLQTNEATRGFAPKLSVRNSGSLLPDGGWTTARSQFEEPSPAIAGEPLWGCWLISTWFLSPLSAQHRCCLSFSPTLVFLCDGSWQ